MTDELPTELAHLLAKTRALTAADMERLRKAGEECDRDPKHQASLAKALAKNAMLNALKIGDVVYKPSTGCEAIVEGVSDDGVLLRHPRRKHGNGGRVRLNSWSNIATNWQLRPKLEALKEAQPTR